jgi:hypothetical protein
MIKKAIIFISPILGSGILLWIIKLIINKAIRNAFDVNIEKLKAENERQNHKIKTLFNEKLEAYAKFLSCAYRCRNLAREIISQCEKKILEESLQIFTKEVGQYEDILYDGRLLTSVNDSFKLLHAYKGKIKAFEQNLYLFLREQERGDLYSNLVKIYEEIDRLFKEIDEKLVGEIKV